MDKNAMSRNERELLRKAEVLMALKGYQQEGVSKSETGIDIQASDPSSDETVLLYIVTNSTLRSGGVGVREVEAIALLLEESDVDKIILFSERFTHAARAELRARGIEYFSKQRRVVPTLNPQEAYSRLLACINELCRIKCGRVPQAEGDCDGYSKGPTACSACGGNGQLPNGFGYYRERQCHVCGGVGLKENHYSCQVRLISDNAYFYFERGWMRFLETNLLVLLKMLKTLKSEQEEWLPLLTQSSPALIQEKKS
jgi:hypothetical protein